jgi:hypothetical protein
VLSIIGIADSENDPNMSELGVISSSEGELFEVLAPKYAWHCYKALVIAGHDSKTLVDRIRQMSLAAGIPLEKYFRKGIVIVYNLTLSLRLSID